MNVSDVTDVYTLINGAGPTAGLTGATVTFNGTGGAFEAFTLTNGADVRDFYQGIFANTINGTTTQNVFSVMDQGGAGTGNLSTGISNQGPVGTYVLDAQRFALSPAFANQTLTSIVITNGPGSSGNALSGVTVVSSASPAVPEPSSFALLGLALPAMGLMVRRVRK